MQGDPNNDWKTAAVAAVYAIARELIPALRKHWARRKAQDQKRGYDGIRRTISALEDGRRASGASRVMLIESRNGGGIPEPGTRVKVSIMYESTQDGTRKIHDDWIDWVADTPYAKLLTNVSKAEHAPVVLTTDRMEEGALKNLYRRDGHVGSFVWLVGHTPDPPSMLYISFNYKKETCQRTGSDCTEPGRAVSRIAENGHLGVQPKAMDAMRACVNQVREIISEFDDVVS